MLRLPRPVFDARIGSNSFGDLPDWDLTDLYESPDCKALAVDLDDVETSAGNFEALYKGELAGLDAGAMLACVRLYENIETTAGLVTSYAGLRYYQNTLDAERAKFMADCEARITDATTPLVFFSLEFNRLDDNHLAGLLAETLNLPATSRCCTVCASCARTSCPTRWRPICTIFPSSAPVPGTSCSTKPWPG